MNRILRYSLFFLAILHTQPSGAVNYRESFKGREWEFIHYKLRVAPNNYQPFRKNKKRMLLLLTLTPICSSIATWFGTYTMKTEIPVGTVDRIGAAVSLGILSLPLGLLIAIVSDLLERSKRNAFLKFVKHWPKNKDYTPSDFHDLFEQLYTLYLHEGETPVFKQKVYKLRCLIGHALNNRFPDGYYTFTTRTMVKTQPIINQLPIYNIPHVPSQQPYYNSNLAIN